MKKFSNELKADLITTAVEGGSNYWYILEQKASDIINKYKEVEHPQNKYHTFTEAIFVALEKGETIPVYDIEEVEESEKLLGNLTKDSLDKAQDLLHDEYPFTYGNILAENFDANDADIWFQLAVMGKVVFG